MTAGAALKDGGSPRRGTWYVPTGLTREEYRDVLRSIAVELNRDDVPSLAAGVAFKIFLSIFPSLIAGVAVFSLVVAPTELPVLLDRIAQVVPTEAVSEIEAQLEALVTTERSLASSAVILGSLAGVWTLTSAAGTLMKALSRAYDVEETRKFFVLRLTALGITAALFVALVSMFVLLVAGDAIENAVLSRLNLVGQARATMDSLSTVLRYVLAVGVLMVLFAFVYWIGPDRDRRPAWEWLSPGAVVGVVGWLLLSVAFRIYVANWGNYGEGSAYAGIGGVIVLLLWLQLSMVALLTGAEVNAELHRLRRHKRDVLDAAGFGADVPPEAGLPDALDATVGQQPGPAAVTRPSREPTAPPAPRSTPATGTSSATIVALAVAAVGLAGLLARVIRRS